MSIAIPRLDRAPAEERGITLADFLVPISLAERVAPRWRHIALIVLGTVFVTLCAQIYIPTQPVPFTGQTFGVLVVGGALGFRRGSAALLLYLAIGAVGLPVFAEGTSGVRPSFGYIVGFVVAAGVVGRLAELGWDRKIVGSLTAMLIGTSIIYAFGVPWLKASLNLTWTDAINAGMTPFLIWDLAKVAIAGALFPLAWYAIGRRPDDR